MLGPTLVISFSAVGFAKTNLQNRAQESILIASNQTASDIDTFIRTTSARVSTSASLPQMSQYLSLAPEERKGSDALRDTQVILGFIAEEQYQRYVSYALLDTNGTAIYDSASNNTSRERANELYFRQVMQTGTAYISPVLFDANNQNPALYFSQPIRSGDGQTIGVLVVRYRADILQSIIKKTTGITGEDSFAILVDENNLRLATGADTDSIYIMLAPLSNEEQTQLIADRRIPNNIGFGEAIDLVQAIEAKQPNTVIKANLTGQHPGDESDGADYYALSTLSDIPWTVLYHQSENSFLGPINRLEQRVVLISLVILALASLAAFIAARLLTSPINKLIEATRRVSEGDLTTAADVTSNDEIGVLAQSFNTMTDQLRGTLTGLERRTRAIETSSEVSRRLSTILDPQQLTVEVVEQLRAAFNYYHAHIYLLNDAKDTLLMAGGTGRAGRTMLANKHQIPIGRGLVGRAASTKEVVLVPDVRQEPGWLPNPLLPETKAEIAVPIMAGSTVLGVLDVQQNSVNGLTQEDAILIQSIADQVAIGLENAHSVQQIKAQQELLLLRERAITASNDGIVIVDPNQFDMPIVFINPAFEKITGYSAADVLGKNCRFLQGADTNQPGVIELRQAIRDKRACNVLLRNYRKDGTMFWNELDVSPVFDDTNQLINFIGVQQDVTDRVNAQQALQEANTLQSAVLNNASSMMIATDAEGTITVFNTAAEEYLGYKAEELIGKHTPAIFHDGQEVVQRAEQISKEVGFTILPGFEVFVHKTRTGNIDTNEWTYIAKDGRRFPVLLSVSAFIDQDGSATGFLGIASDITERKAAEAERERLLAVTQESEQRYRSLAEASQDIITIFDLDGHLEYMNDFIAQRYPVPAEQLYGKHVTQVFGTQQSNFIQSVIQRIADTQAKFTLEYSAENNGQTIWFESQNIPLFDEQGKLDRVMSVGRNITERKAAEVEREKLLAATAAQERTLQTILDNLPMGLFATDQHGVPHTVNKIAQLMLGTDPLPVNVPEFSEVYQIYQPDSDELVPLEELPVSIALRTSETVTTQFDVKVSDTDRLNMLSTAVPMKDRHDNLTGTIVLIQDITDRKQSEIALQEANRLQSAVLNNASYMMIAADPNGTITIFNPAAEKYLGYTAEELIGKQNPGIFHDSAEVVARAEELSKEVGYTILPGFEVFVHKTRDGSIDTNEWTYIAKNGRRYPVLLSVSSLRNHEGDITGFLGIATDISERKQAEVEREQLIEQIQERAIALEAVAEVSTAATSILDTEHLLQTVVDLTKQTFRLYHAHIYLYNEPDETLDLHVGAGEIGARMVKEGRRI
ncbi:MAG: PAS domain S-box protein, partial [Herpetosiphon sp.]|nr:PAS domain S-box protein [Herpetosiphon sp.]